MLKKTAGWAWCIAAAAVLAAPANADFTRTPPPGGNPHAVVSPPAQEDLWAPGHWGDVPTLNDDTHELELSKPPQCPQDITMVFTDDDTEVAWERINLCDIHKVTLRYNKQTGEVSAELE